MNKGSSQYGKLITPDSKDPTKDVFQRVICIDKSNGNLFFELNHPFHPEKLKHENNEILQPKYISEVCTQI